MTKKIIDYLLKNNLVYNKDKPISVKLQKKLDTIKKTNEYRSYAFRQVYFDGKVKEALKQHAVRNKFRVVEINSAFRRYANSIKLENKHFLGEESLKMLVHQKSVFKEFLRNNRNMKLNVKAEALFKMPKNEDNSGVSNSFIEVLRTIPTTVKKIHSEEELDKALERTLKEMLLRIEQIQLSQSNMRFEKVISMTIHYDKYDPTRAGSYIDLPPFIKLKKACVNIKNTDNKCFKYCVQSVVYDIINKNHPEAFFHYKNLNDNIINWDGVNFPAGNKDIERFEENNDGLISVNIFETDDVLNDDKVIIAYRTKVRNAKYNIDLLKIYDENNKCHYTVIKHISKLLNCQSNKNTMKKYYCRYCSHPFTKEEGLNKHLSEGCHASDGQQFTLPKKGSYIEFEKYNTKLPCPFVIYGDFECLTTCNSQGIKGTYQEHKPCGFMMNVVNRIDNTSSPYLYRGEDCMDKFVNQLKEIHSEINDRMKENKKMDITDEQEIEFQNSTRCSICNKCFKEDDEKVRDLCHFTGNYRGSAHVKCNLDYSFRYFKIPVFFHNLKNYDAHLIINKANEINSELNPNKRINLVAQNSEKFITFSFGQCDFKDSFLFLSASLDKLVKLNKYAGKEKLKDWEHNFTFTQSNPYVKNKTDLDLLTEKGVYPYDYMNSFGKFNETTLPSKEHFYSQLYEEKISDKDYERAHLIWKHFNLKNLGEYHDLYLMTDVYLLTDVFENFRDMCLNYYGLDPAYYITLPNYAWSAFLHMTGVRLQQIHIKEMYEMIENGLRGGMTQCTYKKVEANNKYMNEEYDKSKPSSYINYLDANNLYGLAMSKKLPYDDFNWYFKKIDEKKIMNYNDEDETGFILEVDLAYPKEIHDLHKDYPLAPEIMCVSESMLSDVQKEIHKQYYNHEVKDEKTNKLILNVMNKKKYVLHISTLKFYLQHGLKLKKVHRAISFKQSHFLKPYIDFNTEKRKNSKTDFEKDLFKLMNNSVYGKTMENVRKHGDFELVDTAVRFQKLVNKPTYKHRHIIHENLVVVEKEKHKVELNKPIYMGMSILDYSKAHMYSFYYDILKPKYGDNIKLVYTDTDSYVIQVMTDDIYEDFRGINDYMDFSDYPISHPNYDKWNKKVLGKFKDEMNGKIITSFIGLKPKSYCFKVYGEDKEHKKSKGVITHKVNKELNYDKYEETLRRKTKENVKVEFNSIRSKNHQIYSIHQIQYALSNYANKRYWINDTDSLPYGHYSIK